MKLFFFLLFGILFIQTSQAAVCDALVFGRENKELERFTLRNVEQIGWHITPKGEKYAHFIIATSSAGFLSGFEVFSGGKHVMTVQNNHSSLPFEDLISFNEGPVSVISLKCK